MTDKEILDLLLSKTIDVTKRREALEQKLKDLNQQRSAVVAELVKLEGSSLVLSQLKKECEQHVSDTNKS